MTDLFSVDLDEGVLVVRYGGRPDDVAFEDYLERYTALMSRGIPYASVYSTMPSSRMPPVSYVKRQAAWMKEHSELAAKHCRGLAFALPSPLMRGVLRAVLAMQPLGAQHIIVDDEAEAIAWAKGRLR